MATASFGRAAEPPDTVLLAPEWAADAAWKAWRGAPGVTRAATSGERAAHAGRWIELAEDPRTPDTDLRWQVAVVTSGLDAIVFRLELDEVADREELLATAERLAQRLSTVLDRLPDRERGRANHSLATYFRTIVELSATADPLGTLRAGAAAAREAVRLAHPALTSESMARRQHTYAVLARALARAGDGAQWWDEAIRSQRLSVGLGPDEHDIPSADEVGVPEAQPSVEVVVRWQGLSVAYRGRGAALGSVADVRHAVEAADVALAVAPVGSVRGGPLMARAAALLTVAELAEDPLPYVRDAVLAYRLAVELPEMGAARRQKRLTAFGTALRWLHELSVDEPGYRGDHVVDAIRRLADAVRMSLHDSFERPRLLVNLANAIADRAAFHRTTTGHAQAVGLYRQALALMAATPDRHVRDLPAAQLLLADALYAEGGRRRLSSEAEDLFRSALTRPGALEAAVYARTVRRYAVALIKDDRASEALEVLRSARAEFESRELDRRWAATVHQLQHQCAVIIAEGGDAAGAVCELDIPEDFVGVVLASGWHTGRLLIQKPGGSCSSVAASGLSQASARLARRRLHQEDAAGRWPGEDAAREALATTTEQLAPAASACRDVHHPLRVLVDDVTAASPIAAAMLQTASGAVVRSTATSPRRAWPTTRQGGVPSRWLGLFAEDPSLPWTGYEAAALRELLGHQLDARSGERAVVRAGPPVGCRDYGVHVAAHGLEEAGSSSVRLSPHLHVPIDVLVPANPPPRVVVWTVCPVPSDPRAPMPPHDTPAQLLDLGVLVVVSPLWPVRDRAAAAFAALLHESFREAAGRSAPLDAIAAEAVGAAQRRLRELAADELRARFPQLPIAPGPECPFTAERDWAPWTTWA